jgi:hypothetical protein
MPCKGGFWADAVSTDMAHKTIISAKIMPFLYFIKKPPIAFHSYLFSLAKNLSISAFSAQNLSCDFLDGKWVLALNSIHKTYTPCGH